jgi:ketosteroid isomerase-like protein
VDGVTADEVVESYAASWARGEPDVAFALYADDIVLRLPGRSPEAGEHLGRDAVISCIRRLLTRTDEMRVEIEVVDRLVSGDRVALLLRERVRRGEAELDIRRVNVYDVRDGRIARIDVFEGDQYAVDEFFAPSQP